MTRNWVKEYFTFSYKERSALIVLVLLIAIVFFLPSIIPTKEFKASAEDTAAFEKMLVALKKDSIPGEADENNFQPDYSRPSVENNSIERKLFPFDPNTITVGQWQQLGLREKTITTIQKYLLKGGRFKKPEDLLKIYGLREKEYQTLRPYVKIEESRGTSIRHVNNDSVKGLEQPPTMPFKRAFSTVELNTADSNTLIQLPGIGSKLANRIIRFRDKLGGFYSVEQVGETYGLPDSTFQKIKPFLILGDRPLVRININTADAATLKEHPYIGWTAARALVAYRAQHGPFSTIEDVGKVSPILADQIKRLIPYLSTED
jgi:competence ComEA-like helix-hairpin-helix protein